MGRYTIIFSADFFRIFQKCDREMQRQMERIFTQLRENPFVGKPLGYAFFREKKIGKHRMYYLIYEEYVAVFVVALSDKKTQQRAIQEIKAILPQYYEEIQSVISPK